MRERGVPIPSGRLYRVRPRPPVAALWKKFGVSIFALRARAPVGEQCEQVEDADGAVAVEVGRAGRLARAPRGQQQQEIEDVDPGAPGPSPLRSAGAGTTSITAGPVAGEVT